MGWYKHVPSKLQYNYRVALVWDMHVHMEKYVKADYPDIIFRAGQWTIDSRQAFESILIDIV